MPFVYERPGIEWKSARLTLGMPNVLLMRARQAMVIVVPEGSAHDPTRRAEYYDGTFELLR
jgi:hypothetical protein